MGWERRRNGAYHYRKVWRDGRCVSEYVHPLLAALTAPLDAAERGLREANRRRIELEQEEWDAVEATLKDYCERVDLLARAALIAAGYHQHARGHWRRRRGQAQAGQEG